MTPPRVPSGRLLHLHMLCPLGGAGACMKQIDEQTDDQTDNQLATFHFCSWALANAVYRIPSSGSSNMHPDAI